MIITLGVPSPRYVVNIFKLSLSIVHKFKLYCYYQSDLAWTLEVKETIRNFVQTFKIC